MPHIPSVETKIQKAWVVAIDMGYGHQRAAYPLRMMAPGGRVLYADSYPGLPRNDRSIWREQQQFYHFISRFKRAPIVGEIAFDLFDHFQEIKPLYPKRDLSKPSLQLRSTYALIRNKQWGKHFIHALNQKNLPLVTTFFVPAFMAEEHGFRGDIYLVVADADIARAWAPLKPSQSRIQYFVPTKRAYDRLKLYGVPEKNIFLTGFPLPTENIGSETLETLKLDLRERLWRLDPGLKYIPKYRATLETHFGRGYFGSASRRLPLQPLTIMFAVGGAGAQREIGIEIARSISARLERRSARLVLVAGIRNEVNRYFKKELQRAGLGALMKRSISIIFSQTKQDYFKKFNMALRQTDILWTKPSELSFYSALGIPIIMSEPVGSQELYNRKWLLAIGAGIPQEGAAYCDQWLFDWLESGWLAESAMQGFFEGAKFGTYNIQKILSHRPKEAQEFRTVMQY